MAAAVRGEHSEGHPAAVKLLGSLGREAADVVTPEREAAQAERKAATQGGRHAGILRAGIAAPVQRIALAAAHALRAQMIFSPVVWRVMSATAWL